MEIHLNLPPSAGIEACDPVLFLIFFSPRETAFWVVVVFVLSTILVSFPIAVIKEKGVGGELFFQFTVPGCSLLW